MTTFANDSTAPLKENPSKIFRVISEINLYCSLAMHLSHGKNEPKRKKNFHFRSKNKQISVLSVGLGDTLKLVLLLNGVAVRATLGGVDQLVGQTLGDGLDVAEGGFASSSTQQPDCLGKHKRYYYIRIQIFKTS